MATRRIRKYRPSPDRFIRPETELRFAVEQEHADMRLDKFVAEHMPYRSRTVIQRLIAAGSIKTDGVARRPSYRVKPGETVVVPLPKPSQASLDAMGKIPIHVIYEDDAILVVNKQPGIVVHPVGAKLLNTLLNALHLRYRRPDDPQHDIHPKLAHRLDKETSGVLLVAKSDEALRRVGMQLELKSAQKEYLAIVEGEYPEDLREINLSIGWEAKDKVRMKRKARGEDSEEALTLVEVAERLPGHTLLRLSPRTGRTHQLRVHLAAVGYPILCDKLYGRRGALTRGEIGATPPDETVISRQALHAHRLTLRHPISREQVTFTAPLPDDMQLTLDMLRAARRPIGP